MTLNQILELRAGLPIHFLKIDVEGVEEDVLSGIDLNAFRPWIIMVEATEPPSPKKVTRDLWEHLLIKRGYEFAYFDGLNCFYAASEQANLKEKLAVPPNVFDDYLPISQARLQDEVTQQTGRAEALTEALVEAQGGLRSTEIARLAAELEQTQVNQAEAINDAARGLSPSKFDAILEGGPDRIRVEARLKALEEHSTKLEISMKNCGTRIGCDMIRQMTLLNWTDRNMDTCHCEPRRHNI